MNERLKQHGFTPAKGALVAVLAIGLGVVWGPQLAGPFDGNKKPVARASQPIQSAPTPDTKTQRPRRTRGVPPRPSTPVVRDRPTPTIGLAEAVSYDPFAAPRWSPVARRADRRSSGLSADAAELAERFETIRESGVAMILVSGEGRAAQVGDQTLRVGDRVDGFEVVEINDSGVIFRPSVATEDDRGA